MNFRWRGKDYRLSLDRHLGRRIDSKTEAVAEAEKIRTGIREGTFGVGGAGLTATAALTVPGGITWEQFARTYLERRGTPASANEAGYLTRLAAFVLRGERVERFGDKPLSAITEDDCEAAFSKLRQEGKAASTLNKYRLFVGGMFRWGVKTKMWRARQDSNLRPSA